MESPRTCRGDAVAAAWIVRGSEAAAATPWIVRGTRGPFRPISAASNRGRRPRSGARKANVNASERERRYYPVHDALRSRERAREADERAVLEAFYGVDAAAWAGYASLPPATPGDSAEARLGGYQPRARRADGPFRGRVAATPRPRRG